ncbi:MAG: mitochondrial fission ELM1 family protein [Pseudomonadota bacterium]
MPKVKLPENTTCRIFVEEGLKGTENQCIALAHALDIKPETAYVDLRFPWTKIAPPVLWGSGHAYRNSATLFSPPFPDIVIASGRKSILAALQIKKASKGKVFTIQVLDPRISPRHFDLVIAPEHDDVTGDNVIKTTGALHNVSPEFLKQHAGHYVDELKQLPEPRIAVLIGGSTRKAEFTMETAQHLGQVLKTLTKNSGGSLMITASRRTGEAQTGLLRQAVADLPHHFWDGHGHNPYFDYLHMADKIIVTNDSVSMATEAMGTGKPVYVAHIGRQGRRIEKFHDGLAKKGYTKPLSDRLEDWQPPVCDDMLSVCQEIEKRYKAHKEAEG